MKPIKLKIKGLNSFIEEQTIDFEKLTEEGFFGIFGPTGSGKSTILDGITLALYGEVARQSRSFINVNCDVMNVVYEFEILDVVPRRYKVIREIKREERDGKSGTKSGKCKIIEIRDGEEIILETSPTKVTKTCKEIIGLNLNDFTRTVVLPQGKFSEFLKLEGLERRKMLERLFNLQEYGDDLAIKLKEKADIKKTNNSILIGELKGYEEITEEKKELKERSVEESKEKLNKVSQELQKIETEYFENEKIWGLQVELQDECEKRESHLKREEEILKEKRAIELAESAEKVMPYVLNYKEIKEEIEDNKKELEKVFLENEKLEEEKKRVFEKWEKIKEEKENELPKLIMEKNDIEYAQEEKKVVDNLIKEMEEGESKLKTLKEEEQAFEEKILNSEKEEKELEKKIVDLENRLEKFKVNSYLKDKVYDGIDLKRKLDSCLEREKEIGNNIGSFEKEINEQRKNEKNKNEILNIKRDELKEKRVALNNLNDNCPGDRDKLIELNRKLLESERKWNEFNAYTNEIEAEEKEIKILRREVESLDSLKEKNFKEIERLKNIVKEQEKEELANKLRVELEEGNICPVCGSTHHNKESLSFIDVKNIKEMQEKLKEQEVKFDELKGKILKKETEIEQSQNIIESIKRKLEELGEEFKKNTVENFKSRFEKLNNDIEKYETKKESFEKKIREIESEIVIEEKKLTKIETTISEKIEGLDKEKEQKRVNDPLVRELEKQYEELRKETNIEDFAAKNEEIKEKEKVYDEIGKEIKESRVEKDRKSEERKETEELRNKRKEEKIKLITELEGMNKSKEEKIENIKKKVENIETIDKQLNEIKEEIERITENFEKLEINKKDVEKNFSENKDILVAKEAENKKLEESFKKANENLNKKLLEEKFNTKEEVELNKLDKLSIERRKNNVESYNEEKSKILGAIENLKEKLRNREVSEEKWNKIQEEKEIKKEEFEVIQEENIKLNEELKTIKDKLFELGDLKKKKEKLDHELGILSDLEKLFKGKKFVEFVATARLKYVSMEASKRLKEITNGNYGLEVDEESKFIIRDYKNGGIMRESATLSGGETFVASLALALALSAEIQLKGKAPLELFFLDEGFGTLDENLLEVVISSLEKIHHKKLKIGLISHVESIKNRVPIKLIVTGAEAGRGGSKIKIEKS